MWIVDEGGKKMDITFATIFFFMFGILVGTLVGYLVASLRIRSYLKKYYPDVDFQQTRKERKVIITENNKEKE
jgi:NhaP-type Na+/H+ or K+/H+ antiporter